MRQNLKAAREKANLSVDELARMLNITDRYYRALEAGTRNGNFGLWDALEDLFLSHQRILRENFPSD